MTFQLFTLDRYLRKWMLGKTCENAF